jgi:cobalt-zinc-cadmium efflux system protein
MMAIEFLAGFLARSISLVSDAGHMFVDAFALGCAFVAACICAANKKSRSETYAALINGIVLGLMAVFILKSSLNRFFHPVEIKYQLMIIVAAIGFLVNLLQFLIMRKGNIENINIRGAFLHIISDGLSSVGVIIGGIVIYFTGWYKIDSVLGFIIGIAIFRYGFRLIRDSIKILKNK